MDEDKHVLVGWAGVAAAPLALFNIWAFIS
jgi:hypothetical protein